MSAGLEINYEPEPTAAEFHACDDFCRGILGPVGCLSGDTEYLTPSGWRRMDSYDPAVPAAQWEPNGGLSFVTPLDYIDEPCDAMWHFRSAHSLSMVLTGNHRVPVYDWSGAFRVKSADELAAKPSRHVIPTTFTAQDGLGLTDIEIRLRVMVAADGHYPSAGNQCVVTLRKERKKARLEWLLHQAGIDWTEHHHANRPTETRYVFARPAFDKGLGAEWFSASSGELAVLLDECTRWDGLNEHVEARFYSSKKLEADVVQFAAHANGMRATISRVEYQQPEWQDGYVVHIAKGRKAKVGLRVDATSITRVPQPRQYCFTMPSGFFLARHDGRVFVTGNSGKSVACTLEMFIRGCCQRPVRDAKGRHVRKSRWAAIRNCYDDQTEILTEARSWRLFRDLLPEDKVATLVDDKLTFQQPESVYAAPFEGDMVGFESEGVDFLVTPDHLMYVSKMRTRAQTWGEYGPKKAEDCFGDEKLKVRRDADWEGEDIGLSEALCEWIGLWFAEGSTGTYGGRIKHVLTSKNNLDDIRELFQRAGIGYFENRRQDGGVNFVVHQSCEVFATIRAMLGGKSHSKAIPARLKGATKAQLQAFLRGYLAGDGHVRREGTRTLYTSSERLADDLQEIALKAGEVANLHRRDRRGQAVAVNGTNGVVNHVEYSVTLTSKRKHSPRLRASGRYRGWYRQPYNGMVYCVEMPLVPVYVRRNGRAFWCYRTYPELKTTTIKTFQDWFPPEVAKFRWDIPITCSINMRLADGTWLDLEVIFIAMDRPQDVNKLKSLELTGAWLNEAAELPKAALDMATSRVGRYPSKREGGPSWRGIIMDTNPPDDDHWYYNLAEEEKPQVKLENGTILKYTFFRQPPALLDLGTDYAPNPAAENIRNLEGGYDYYFQQIPGKTREWVRVFVQGQYGTVHDGKRVYPEYSDGDHCAAENLEPTRGLPLLLGWDFGLTPACIISQWNVKGRLEVIDELVSEDMGIRQFAREIVKPYLLNNYTGLSIGASIGDPAGGQRSQQSQELTCLKELLMAGIPTEPAFTNEFIARRESVAGLLTRRDGFILSPKCKTLRKGFNGGYKFERVQIGGDDRYRDVPSKNRYSHPHDALQYIALHVEQSITRSLRRSYRREVRPVNAAGWT